MDTTITLLTNEINELRDFLSVGDLPLDNIESDLYEMEDVIYAVRNKEELHKRNNQCERIHEILHHASATLSNYGNRALLCAEKLHLIRGKTKNPTQVNPTLRKAGEHLNELAESIEKHSERLVSLDKKLNTIQKNIYVKNYRPAVNHAEKAISWHEDVAVM